jgi:hypothetical protein
MWRFGWVFFLLAMFFEVLAFGAGFLALCSRLGSALTGLISLVALVFLTVAVSLMTYVPPPLPPSPVLFPSSAKMHRTDRVCHDSATFVKMRNVFVSEGRDASIGKWAFGFGWGAWAALLISTVLFCLSRRKRSDAAAVAPVAARPRRVWPWQRKNTVASRHSYDGRRVKDEYA